MIYLKGFLVERGYDHDFIDTQFLRVRNHDRADLLESKKKLGNKDNFGDRVVVLLIIIRLYELFKSNVLNSYRYSWFITGICKGFERKTFA